MSQKERKRLVVLAEVKKSGMTVAQAGRVMGVGYRQAKRIWQRYKAGGDSGLVHRSRGKPGPRNKGAILRQQVVSQYQARYEDFGPTLASEKLKEDGLEVDHETLRRWLVEAKLWTIKRVRQKHRSWRPRKECFGEMVQMDGSHHDWFEGRRQRAVLMVMVDDATNQTMAWFSEEETTEAAYQVLEGWIRAHGLPGSLYVDRDSIYRCERVATVAEQVEGKEPQTQFGRAMTQLGVELLLAYSPQAKGRVERQNGLLQDRLVKELRLAGIRDLEKANEFLAQEFLPALNARFAVQAKSRVNVHRKTKVKLEEILSWEEGRKVGKDWTIAWRGRWFQIEARHERLSLVGREVLVRELRNGTVQLVYKGRKLHWKELPQRPVREQSRPTRSASPVKFKHGPDHPWRRVKQARYPAHTGSGQPPLRSGFPAPV